MAKNEHSIHNIAFDLGGVLLDWNPDKIVAMAFADAAEGRRVLKDVFLHTDWLEFDAGRMTEADAVRRFARKTGLTESAMRRLFDVYRDCLSPFPESVRLFYELRGRGLRLYCVSNIHDSIFEDLRKRHAFLGDFDGVVTSGRIGELKPHPAIYEHLLRSYGLAAAETVFIDDRADNVEGAIRVGLRGIVFTDVTTCRRQLAGLMGET